MKKIAIYPGTFDPITYGHIDVIKKSLKIVDNIIVAISNGNQQNYLFTAEERIEIVKQALFKDSYSLSVSTCYSNFFYGSSNYPTFIC